MVLFTLFVFRATLEAQDIWTPLNAVTAQNLWGVCFGAGQFVAVGENGTVLTSPEGLAWSLRTADTTRWLLAVAYSAELQRYVAVGDQGLVLTSTDAITWTARPSGTSQRLNGVAFGGGRFLAVGEAGVACVSTDGITWTSNPAGVTSDWLRGVVYGAGRFVICGQTRLGFDPQTGASGAIVSTVLTTSDGVRFDSSSAPTPAGNLEALAFDGRQFSIAGNVVALAPAGFPLAWKTKFVELSGISLPPFRNFRGVAFFNNTWVAAGTLSAPSVGQNAPVVYAQPNALSWQNASGVPGTASLTAVAASPTVAVAVGLAGLMVRSAATQSAPQPFLISQPVRIVAAVGGGVQLSADARGTADLSYQWNFNGAPIAGATQPALTLTNLQLAQTGSYALTATNVLGSGTSSPYFITVVSPLAVTAPVDPNFISPLTAAPGPFAMQPDGKVLVNAPTTPTAAGSQPRLDLVRLNPDGSIDSTFRTTTGANLGSIELLVDGHILVAAFSGFGRTGLVRLNSDGTVDPTFSPPPLTGAHVLLADGRLVSVTISNNVATFARFNADGSADPTYSGPPITLGLAPPGSLDANYTGVLSTATAPGPIMVVAVAREVVGTGVFFKNESKIFRLGADGTVDPTFPLVTVPEAIGQFVSSGGGFLYLASSATQLGSSVRYHIARLNADGRPDPAYQPIQLVGGIPVFPVIQLARDGSVYFAAANTTALVSYDSDGARDREFSARFASGVTFSRLLPIDGGRLLVSGNFTQLNGAPTPYLARLLPDLRLSATRLTNLSIRQFAGTGNQTLIVGFVLSGRGDRSLLLRGVGPTLAAFAVANPLADPELSLLDGAGALRLTNDNWGDGADTSVIAATSARVGGFALPAGSKDAAMIATLPAGAFTLQLGARGATGVALAEGYDTGDTPSDYAAARIVNLSARANAGVGEGTLIAGFTISGPNVKRVMVRAVGPALSQFGVTDVLVDPQLTLYHGSVAIAANDNWGGDSELGAAFVAAGAFPLLSGGKDAALLITLPPGSYTAQVNGAGSTTGVALVEVYEVP